MSNEPITIVVCDQADCLFHRGKADTPGKALCAHREKPHYMEHAKCPLYRLDWQKKNQTRDPKDFLKIFKP